AKAGHSEGERANFAAAWSKSMSSYFDEHGTKMDLSKAEAYMQGKVAGGFSLLGNEIKTEAGAKGSVDYVNQHRQQTNLLTASGAAIYDTALRDARAQHLS